MKQDLSICPYCKKPIIKRKNIKNNIEQIEYECGYSIIIKNDKIEVKNDCPLNKKS